MYPLYYILYSEAEFANYWGETKLNFFFIAQVINADWCNMSSYKSWEISMEEQFKRRK